MAQTKTKFRYDEVVARDISFNLHKDNVHKHWFNDDPWNTIWLTAILAAVPEGERWGLRAVAKLLNKVKDPGIRETGVAFCKQERIHAREHDVMNSLIIEDGLPLDKIEKPFAAGFEFIKKHVSTEMQGALAASAEHFTAIIASVFLEHPEAFKDTDPEIVNMLYWHFVEETEHKAVSFDVFTDASGNHFAAYLRRVFGMASMTALGAPVISISVAYLLWHDKQLTNIPSARRMFETLFGEPGIMRNIGKLYLPFYRPSFHPWDDDNREVINVWKSAYEKSGDPAEAYQVFCGWIQNQKPAKASKKNNSPFKAFSSEKVEFIDA